MHLLMRQPAAVQVELLEDDEFAALDAACRAAEEGSTAAQRPPAPGRLLPASLSSDAAQPPRQAALPSLTNPGPHRYLTTAYEVERACAEVLAAPPACCGFDIEWRVTYKTGETPRPVALFQLCFRRQAAYTCLLLHVARSGLTHSLREVLASAALLKVGVGAHGDALKVQRDFGLVMAGVLDLSEYANARLCGAGAGAAPPQKWSLAALSERLLRRGVEKRQTLRCSDWEAPLTAEQQTYAATDAWASLRLYEVLSEMPVTWQAAAAAAAAPEGAAPEAPEAGWVPACASPAPLQPAKLAVFELHARQGWTFAQIAAHRRIAEDTAQAYCAEAVASGLAYAPARLGVAQEALQAVADVAGGLLGRRLACSAGAGPAAGGGEPVDVLAALLAATGGGIRQLREGHFPEELGFGQLRLALAHLGRCNPGPWG
jgi:hypothetical protein